MNVVESFIEKNPCYSAKSNIKIKGLMLHSIGVNQPKASVIAKNFNKESAEACAHAVIDGNDGIVYQLLPWTKRAWHAGWGGLGKAASANGGYIGIEMCEPSCIKYKPNSSSFTVSEVNLSIAQEVATRTYKSAVELFADLCKEFSLDPLADDVIISHKEGNNKGIASAHEDPEHLWRGLSLPFTMDTFRKDVKNHLDSLTNKVNSEVQIVEEKVETSKESAPTIYRVRKFKDDASTQIGAFRILENAIRLSDSKPGYFVFDGSGNLVYPVSDIKLPFMVQSITDEVEIRTGPGLEYKSRNITTGKGVFTIVEVSGQNGSNYNTGWGLLKAYKKNRDGWVPLERVIKLK